MIRTDPVRAAALPLGWAAVCFFPRPLRVAIAPFVFYDRGMSAEPIQSRPDAGAIRALLERHVLELPADFPQDRDLFEAGLDSMAIMQLLLHLEEDFGVKIPMGEVTAENFSTTAAIARLVAAKSTEHGEENRGGR